MFRQFVEQRAGNALTLGSVAAAVSTAIGVLAGDSFQSALLWGCVLGAAFGAGIYVFSADE